MVGVKPPRLRAACTNCHAAKVKCSGEKEGCSRCRLHGLDCAYQVSMVGRAPKRRTTGRSGASADDDDELESSGAVVDSSMSFGALPDGLDPTVFLSQFHTGHMSVPEDSTSPFIPEALNFPPESFAPFFPPGGLTPEHTTSSKSVATPPTTAIQSSLAAVTAERIPPFLRDRGFYAQFGPTGELMVLIEGLEGIVQRYSRAEEDEDDDGKVNHDDAIRQTRQAMNHVNDYVDTESFMRCNACGALVATVADLVRGVYELVGMEWGILEQDEEQEAPLLSPQKGPQFLLGSLTLDPDEQTLLRRLLLRRDLNRYLALVDKCARISREVGWVGGQKPVSGKGWSGVANTFGSAVQEGWWEGMREHAGRLMGMLEKE